MEAFSLLKYWRATTASTTTTNLRTSSTISTSISHSTEKTSDDDDDEEEEENGPFFDLEFAVPDEEKATDGVDEEREDEGGDSDGTESENEEREGEGEFKFALEPSDELFFNGNLVPVVGPPSTADLGSGETPKTQFSLMKSASKFGVLMLKLKKSTKQGNGNANAGERTEDSFSLAKQGEKEAEAQTQNQKPSQSKLFTVKFKVEEVPIVSLFTRDNSSRASSITTTATTKSQKKETSAADESFPDEKRASKDGVQKYLKMVKPMYIRVSKRHGGEKPPAAGFSGHLVAQYPVRPDAQKSEKTEACEEKGGNKQGKLVLPAGLRVVCKHLGKSRSASSAAVAAAPPVQAAAFSQGRRRDDSLLEQQDGIQSAILHCKRSFNLSRELESTLFSRSVSDPSPKNPSN